MPFPTCCLAFHVSCQALCVVSLALNYLCTPRHTWLVPMSLSLRIDLDSLPKLDSLTRLNPILTWSHLESLLLMGAPWNQLLESTQKAKTKTTPSCPRPLSNQFHELVQKGIKPGQHQVVLGLTLSWQP